ncbi:mechanosensitive ion channel protein MscS [Halorubrum ezzemoulense]|uniref:Mechanosensitive ion channel n=1 Tax=Halorubrum ezzemoulense TaxID=337243 RepID=A0A256K728_HALEZ|nr:MULTISPECIES: mechanosensitive ion channel domain-containing protein [Halorubrum]OYR57065.1 mechanosensitive ion channel protein MscS [Halorubrum ezzemoulense]OYR76944.1 mechanosensitive ion channel protein MscS [Halorubrum ezzemoulense]OYR78272.1 mechanosensitive ion channel protein MscS [Halorubrum ezzemoulense]PHQ40976.1 mechanosensitive ion channel protein MscS [Halorubrum sp. C191]QAY20032.1 mechanosensitive ion channel [Halorubrum ezzemoulense]
MSAVQITVPEFLLNVRYRIWLALAVLLFGLALAYLTGVINRRLLRRAGVPEVIEGTTFERTAREFDTSTVRILAQLSSYFIVAVAVIVALTVADVNYLEQFWSGVAAFLPRLFVAAVVVIVGVVVGDKAELLVAERLRGIKLPELGVLPTVVNYSVVYVAALIALGQVGVQTLALIVLLAAYAFAVVLFAALATKDLVASAAAGVFLLLRQPYSIGDEVRVAGERGVVQEVDLFVTHIETDGEEHVLPNHVVFREGIVLIRE